MQIVETIEVLDAITQATGTQTFSNWNTFVQQASNLGYSEIILENGMSTGQWILNGLANGTVQEVAGTSLVVGSATQFAPIVEAVSVDAGTGAVTTTAVGGAGAVSATGVATAVIGALGAGIIGVGVGDIISDEIERINPDFWFEFYDYLENETGITLKDNELFTMIADGVNYISEFDLETIYEFLEDKGIFSNEVEYDEPDLNNFKIYDFFSGNFASYYNKKAMATDSIKTQMVDSLNNLIEHFNITIGENDLAIFQSDYYPGNTYTSKYSLRVYRNANPIELIEYKNQYATGEGEGGESAYKIHANFSEQVNVDKYSYYYLDADPFSYQSLTANVIDISQNNNPVITLNRGIMFDNMFRVVDPVEGFYIKEDETQPDGRPLPQVFPSWYSNGKTVTYYDPETQTTKQTKFLPLSMTDGEIQTISQTELQTGSITDPETQTQLEEFVKNQSQTEFSNYKPPTTIPSVNEGTAEPTGTMTVDGNCAFVTLYNPTKAQLIDFNNWLWSNNFFDNILKLFQDPMEAIIGLHKIYATPSQANPQNIVVGRISSGVQSITIDEQFIDIDCGEVAIPMKYGNVTDFEPYVEIYLFLPFINFVKLNANDVMNSIVSINYKVDVITGNCVAMVSVKKDTMDAVLYTFCGNCAETIPITASSLSGLFATAIGAVGGAVATVATGGSALPAILGAGMTTLGGAKTSVQRGGNFSGNTGAMLPKIPYIVVKRTIPAPAQNYPYYYGEPANKYVELKLVHGFTRVKDIHLENINATDDEKYEIERLLKEGVML